MQLSKRVSVLSPSTTLEITAKANALKAAGQDVIGLGAGEPDFNTPDHIIEAAYEAMQTGLIKYTPSSGLPALKESIIEKLKKDQNLDYNSDEIIVCSGAKHALYTIFQAYLNEGDEVIIPTPFWVSYPEQVKLAGGLPVYVEGKESNEFKVTPEQIESAVTDQTKAIVINSPSNPTGMLYSKEELAAIGEVCLKHNLLIVSDEIYEKLTYGDAKHVSIAEISEDLKSQTVVINGVSKSHSMTGWRLGYAAGNAQLIKAMTNHASHSTSNPSTISQYAAIAAYNGPQEPVEKMRRAFEERLNKLYERLISIEGFTCIKPQGAFYLFPNAKEVATRTGYLSVDEFTKAILEEANVALVPGSGFGAPDNVRLSYATSLDILEDAIDRIARFVAEKTNS